MKTKTTTRQLLMALICIATTFNAWSYDLELDNIYYNLSASTASATVTYGEQPYSGYVFIPSSITYNGTIYTVRYIGKNAFVDCDMLLNITLPNTLDVIDRYAFQGCTNLYGSNGYPYFYLPESVYLIGDYAFSGGNAITKFEVDPNNDLYSSYNGAVYNKSKTRLVCCPSSLPQTEITSIFFSSNVTQIGNGAFANCNLISRVEIPLTVTQIGGMGI